MQWCILNPVKLDDIRSIIFEEYHGPGMKSAENSIEIWGFCCYLLIIFHLSCILSVKLNIKYNEKVKWCDSFWMAKKHQIHDQFHVQSTKMPIVWPLT